MTELRIITVDDEWLALRRLQLALDNIPDVIHVGSARGGAEALRLVEKHRPDVILLDVNLRGGSGFDIVEKLIGDEPPAVIFVSAFDSYAAKAFEVRAIDYILKPVGYDRLRSALDRVRSEIATRSAEERIAELKEVIRTLRDDVRAEPAQRYEAEFWVRRNVTGLLRVPVETIDWISADDDYVCLHTNSGNHLLRDTIRGILGRLNPSEFIRIHRSSVVRIAAIQAVKRNGVSSREVHLANGTRLKVGRVYNKALKQVLA